MISGLLIGVLFGFLLKRSRICIAGGLRDVYLEKNKNGLLVLLLMIFTCSTIFFVLVQTGVVPPPKTGKSFSIAATVVGSLLFGFGAILASGCSTMMLVKTGDGRISGLIALLSFLMVVTASKKGLLSASIETMQSWTKVNDGLAAAIPSPLILSLILLAAVLFWAFGRGKQQKNTFKMPQRYHGLRHILAEKLWDKKRTAILIGALAGLSFYLSGLTGRVGSWGITTPLYSWANAFMNGSVKLSWASFFVLGILGGSFLTALISGEFHIQGSDGLSLLKSALGGAFMAYGAVLAKGCLIGHGIIGTSQYSAQSYLALLFIILGLWLGAKIFYQRA
ncbi:hypothetical protein ABB02_00729 [Clostridiaceae bacterium JG1575]|nr:hypothetical protein ABB02_00729 [Clostridiaceae bacterium JG1575]